MLHTTKADGLCESIVAKILRYDSLYELQAAIDFSTTNDDLMKLETN